jgi:hypothetical protein
MSPDRLLKGAPSSTLSTGAGSRVSVSDVGRSGLRPASVAQWGVWVVLPLLLATWVGIGFSRYYYVYDEWTMIDRVRVGPWYHEMFLGLWGHLNILPYWIYSMQVNWLGVEGNWFVYFVFCASLVALQLSVAALLVRLGLPPLVAILAAGLVSYFGRGSETMVYELEFAANFALAFCCFAAFVALRDHVDWKTALVVAALLVTAAAWDSGLALPGAVFAGSLILLLWPWRLAVIALAPPLAAHFGWLALNHSQLLVTGRCMGCDAAYSTAPWDQSRQFAFNLTARAAGGLVGGFEIAGIIGLSLATICITIGLARGKLPRRALAALTGGLLAAGVTVVSITYSRAGLWPSASAAIDMLGGWSNRFIQQVALFLLMGLAPAVAASVRPRSRLYGQLLAVAVAAGLFVVFALNLSSVHLTRDSYGFWGSSVKTKVRESATVLRAGCSAGKQPDPHAHPLKELSPQISVALLQHLLSDGSLTRDFGRTPTPEVRASICR